MYNWFTGSGNSFPPSTMRILLRRPFSPRSEAISTGITLHASLVWRSIFDGDRHTISSVFRPELVLVSTSGLAGDDGELILPSTTTPVQLGKCFLSPASFPSCGRLDWAAAGIVPRDLQSLPPVILSPELRDEPLLSLELLDVLPVSDEVLEALPLDDDDDDDEDDVEWEDLDLCLELCRSSI